MKNLIKKILERIMNRRIKPINIYEEKLEPIKEIWLKNKNIQTIFDIGAHNGGYATRARKIFPKARIYSFEALQDEYKNLINRFEGDDLFSGHNIALSNYNGETPFYKSDYTGSSSILEMSDLHKSAYPYTANNKEIKIRCCTLDDYIIENKILVEDNILLKIDVQGAEMMVLEGASDLLDRTSVILSEVSFNTVYKSNVLFNDISEFLKKRRFKIEGIKNVSQSLVDGTYLQADAYFTKIV